MPTGGWRITQVSTFTASSGKVIQNTKLYYYLNHRFLA